MTALIITALTILLLWAVVATVFAVKIWRRYFELVEFHEKFLERLEETIASTNEFMQIPMFQFSEDVQGWVYLVHRFRNFCMTSLQGIIEIEPDPEIEDPYEDALTWSDSEEAVRRSGRSTQAKGMSGAPDEIEKTQRDRLPLISR